MRKSSVQQQPKKTPRLLRMDFTILIVTVSLALIGVVMVFSASYYASVVAGGSGIAYLLSQFMGVGIGLAAMLTLSMIDYHIFSKKYVILGILIFSVVTLSVVLFTESTLGANRWLKIPGTNQTFQPSEIGRFGVLLFCSAWFAEHQRELRSKKFGVFIRKFWPALLIVGIICGLILMGKNLSMTACTGLMFLCLLFFVGVNWRQVLLIDSAALAVGVGGIFMESYRVDRLTIFLDPWKDPLDNGYQLIQSLYALGDGGLFGTGLGNGRQKLLYLKFSESDFIMSVIGEELGFLGVGIVLLLFGILIWRGMTVASRAPDTFGTLLAGGIVALIAIQTIIHIAVVSSVMPPTGIPLPFISKGNTSLVLFMAEIGILLNISSRGRKT